MKKDDEIYLYLLTSMTPAIKMQNINIMLHYAPYIYAETCELQTVNMLHAPSCCVRRNQFRICLRRSSEPENETTWRKK